MGWTFALASRDPNLVGCVLHALDAQRPLRPAAPFSGYGLGYYVGGEPLLERQPGKREGLDVHALAKDIESEVLLAAASQEGVQVKDENTQPFRFRRWLFAHAGEVSGFAEARPALHRALPASWQGHLRGDTASEYVFLYVLNRLRERTGLDDSDSSSGPLGFALREGLSDFERVLREAGITRPASLRCVLTNGQGLAVARLGGPCGFRLIEGLLPCARCGIDERTPESHPALRPHRRLRAVAFVSEDGVPGFTPMDDRSVITVSPQLELKTERL